MKDFPLVSVITPSFNQGQFIQDTILSVKGQDYPNVEHLVIDGGSTDTTLAILKQHHGLIWRSEPDRGQGDAINKGFGMAKGDILGWLNSDDVYASGAITRIVEYFLDHPDVDVVYGDCGELDENGQVCRIITAHPVDLRRLLLLDFTLYQPTFFFRRRAIEKIKEIDVTLHMTLDYDYIVRAAMSCTLAYLPVTLASFRPHARSKSCTHPEDFLPEYLTVLRRVFSDPALPSELTGLRRRAFSTVYLYGGEQSLKAGRYTEARARFVKSLALYPHPFRFASLKATVFIVDLSLDVTWGRRIIGLLRRMRRDAAVLCEDAHQRPSVLMVTGAYYPELSGAGLQCRELVHHLRGSAKFTVLTTTTDRALSTVDEQDSVPVHRVFVDPSRLRSKVMAMARFSAVLLRHRRRFAIVHLHGVSQKSMFVMCFAWLMRRPLMIKLTSVGHDDPLAIKRRGGLRSWFYSRATHYVGVSSAMKGLYQQSALPASRFRLIPNGVNVERFRPAKQPERERLRRELGLPPDGLAVLYVGFFSREKRPDLLFDAWSRVALSRADSGPLILVGATRSSYYEVDAHLAEGIRRRASDLGLDQRVVFVEQTLHIENYYRASQMFVLPSVREGLPNALLEAMACGLACIATRLPGVTDDIIEDGVNGRLVPPDDASAIEHALRELADDPHRRLEWGCRARETAVTRFAIARVAEKYLEAYRAMTSGAVQLRGASPTHAQ